MSNNFLGVTFAKQKVSPSDDAIIRRAALSDGILTGCALSYSGSTLTMAAGQLLICGRQIKHPSSQNWAIVDATSGYARVVLTIDLTRTASKDVFDQVLDTIEYASSVDGFSALEQADINAAGIRYQAVLAVVSLGTGGITGIASQLTKSEGSGGGANLFSVISVLYPEGGTCTCTNGSRTYTAKDTSGRALFAVPEAGAWTITCSDGISTATKTVSITYAGQIETVVLAYSLYLYDAGNEYTSITGGWSLAKSNGDASGETLKKNTNNMQFASSYVEGSHFANGFLCPANAIDLTAYNLMRIHLTSPTIKPAVPFRFGCSPSRINDAYSRMTALTQIQTASGDVVVDCDIANVSKSMYIGVAASEGASNGASSCTVTKVLLL